MELRWCKFVGLGCRLLVVFFSFMYTFMNLKKFHFIQKKIQYYQQLVLYMLRVDIP